MRFNFIKLNIKKCKKEVILMFASLLSMLGAFAASFGSQGCVLLTADEPKMPRALIEK